MLQHRFGGKRDSRALDVRVKQTYVDEPRTAFVRGFSDRADSIQMTGLAAEIQILPGLHVRTQSYRELR
jgi:hypothetical protein